MRRAVPAPVIVTTTYSTTPIDVALLWPFMAQVERACQERRAKSRPENKKNSTKPGVRVPA